MRECGGSGLWVRQGRDETPRTYTHIDNKIMHACRCAQSNDDDDDDDSYEARTPTRTHSPARRIASRLNSGLGMRAPLFLATRTRVPSSRKRRLTLVGWLVRKG